MKLVLNWKRASILEIVEGEILVLTCQRFVFELVPHSSEVDAPGCLIEPLPHKTEKKK